MRAGRVGGVIRRAWGNRVFLGVLGGVIVLGVFAASGLAAVPPPSGCKDEILVLIPGVTDGLGAKGHKDWIEIFSYSWGVSRVAGGGVEVEEFTIVKQIDKASPKLYESLASGGALEMTVAVCSGGGGGGPAADFKEYVVYDMKEARVVSMGTGTGAGSSILASVVGVETYRHMEDVSFTYGKISIDYTAQGGAVETLECGGADWNDCTWATP